MVWYVYFIINTLYIYNLHFKTNQWRHALGSATRNFARDMNNESMSHVVLRAVSLSHESKEYYNQRAVSSSTCPRDKSKKEEETGERNNNHRLNLMWELWMRKFVGGDSVEELHVKGVQGGLEENCRRWRTWKQETRKRKEKREEDDDVLGLMPHHLLTQRVDYFDCHISF